jgi:hypothetical protein
VTKTVLENYVRMRFSAIARMPCFTPVRFCKGKMDHARLLPRTLPATGGRSE